MPKTRINVSLDKDLAEFAKLFAAENQTSVASRLSPEENNGMARFCGNSVKDFAKNEEKQRKTTITRNFRCYPYSNSCHNMYRNLLKVDF